MYVLPGFIDMHGHIGGIEQGTPAEYVFKLWMGHGVTTVRDPGIRQRPRLGARAQGEERQERDHRAAPQGLRLLRPGPRRAVHHARAGARLGRRDGAARAPTASSSSATARTSCRRRSDEAKKLGLRTACHHAQLNVSRVNVLDSARWGLTTMEHWYGLPEALFDRPHDPGLSARLQLHQRGRSLRRGRPAVDSRPRRRAASAGTR